MRVLVVTNMYPTEAQPVAGTFIATQVESLRNAGVEIEVLFIERPLGGRRVYRRLGRLAQERFVSFSPHLVHVMYGGVMAATVTRVIRERPVLISFCGDDLLGTPGGIVDSLSGRYSIVASHLAAGRAAGIIVKSPNLLDALPRRIDRSRVWTVPNGVDFSRFRPRDRSECERALGWSSARSHVLFPADPGRPGKRFALARAAVALLNEGGAEVELHTLRDVPHEEVPVWLNAASAILITSTHEGSPNAVKEALACDVPVVSVDVGDVGERIRGIDGCFIANPTPKDLAAKVARVLERREPIDARRRVGELRLERVAEKVTNIYETLTDGAVPIGSLARAEINVRE
jgi:glycosyltransferase involved in cell wall biosynthesis